MRITTWNVNSIRRRIDTVLRWIEAERPDILCLQETKCTEDKFPWTGFASLGYTHLGRGTSGLQWCRNRVTLTAKRSGHPTSLDA